MSDQPTKNERPTLAEDIATVINCHSAENGSNTPDFILGEYLKDCLDAFDRASRWRELWYGKSLCIGSPHVGIKQPTAQETK